MIIQHNSNYLSMKKSLMPNKHKSAVNFILTNLQLFLRELTLRLDSNSVVPKVGVNYPSGVICDFFGGNA